MFAFKAPGCLFTTYFGVVRLTTCGQGIQAYKTYFMAFHKFFLFKNVLVLKKLAGSQVLRWPPLQGHVFIGANQTG